MGDGELGKRVEVLRCGAYEVDCKEAGLIVVCCLISLALTTSYLCWLFKD